jgi:tetratricopeptide (TPR) repeat protein
VPEPALTDDITAAELDAEVRRDLRGLQRDTAEAVARHLVAAGRLVDEDPGLALEHARFARARASRIAVVREAAGIAAYHAGEWAEALGELRAARRMGGGPGHVAVMADIERALGRPERALELSRGPEVRELDRAEGIELAIVAAGARRDLGELDAAVVSLQIPELDAARRDPWSARLFYAYADNLLAAGREPDALQWFVHAADADEDADTDAARRIAELTGEELPEDEFDIGVEEEQPTAPDAASSPPGDTGAPAAEPSAPAGGGTERGGGATSSSTTAADSDSDSDAAAGPGSGHDDSPGGNGTGERATGTGSAPADPAPAESAAAESAAAESAAAESAAAESAAAESAAAESAAAESAAAESASGESAPGEPAPGEPAPAESASGEPAPGEPAPGEPAPGESTSGGSTSGGSTSGGSASGGSASAESATGEPASAESASGEPASGGSAPAESASGESASAGSASGERASEWRDADEERGPGASG